MAVDLLIITGKIGSAYVLQCLEEYQTAAAQDIC